MSMVSYMCESSFQTHKPRLMSTLPLQDDIKRDKKDAGKESITHCAN